MDVKLNENSFVSHIQQSNTQGWSLFYGKTGELLFYSTIKNKGLVELMLSQLQTSIENEEIGSYDFAYGLSGIFTALIDLDLLEPKEIAFFTKNLSNMILNLDDQYFLFDPFQGILGYFQLLRSTKTFSNEILDFFITKLENNKHSSGFYKENTLHPKYKEYSEKISSHVSVNLGMAHGNIAILYWLYFFEKQPYRKNEFKKKRQELENYFINLIVITPDENLIAAAIYSNGDSSEASLGWCYSELPLIYILLSKGKLKKNNKTIVLNKIKDICNNFDRYLNQITEDFAFCHGVPGILYLLLKISVIHQMSEVQIIIDKLKSLVFSFDYHKTSDIGFLSGNVGLGLVLKSIELNKFSDFWDKYLLIDCDE